VGAGHDPDLNQSSELESGTLATELSQSLPPSSPSNHKHNHDVYVKLGFMKSIVSVYEL